MTLDIPAKYLARVFLAATNLDLAHLDAFRDEIKGMIGGELALLHWDEPALGKPLRRPALVSQSLGVSLVFTTQSIDLQRVPSNFAAPDLGMGGFESFLSTAAMVLPRALVFVERKAHRVAAVQEGLITALTPDQLRTAATTLLRMPPALNLPAPAEWDWRVATSVERAFKTRTELTNTIVTIKRMVAELLSGGNLREEDGLFVSTDINTSPLATVERLTGKDVEAFFEGSSEWHASLLTSLMRAFREGASQ
jgi:hypothetical protein